MNKAKKPSSFRTPVDFIQAATAAKDQFAIDANSGTVSIIKGAETRIHPPGDDFAVVPDTGQPQPSKTPQKPINHAAKKPKAPWADASDKMVAGYSFRMSEVMHQKLLWIAENVPRHSSIQKIIHKATHDLVEQLIKEHYKP